MACQSWPTPGRSRCRRGSWWAKARAGRAAWPRRHLSGQATSCPQPRRGTATRPTGRHPAAPSPHPLAPALLLPDVGELLVDPVSGVACIDDHAQSLGAQAALLGVHRQRAIDRVRLLLDVERVDGQAAVPELLVGA